MAEVDGVEQPVMEMSKGAARRAQLAIRSTQKSQDASGEVLVLF